MALQIGVIGCGAIGQDHIRRISRALAGARVVAVHDIDAAQARAAARLAPGAEVCGDSQALMAAPQVQALLVTCWGPAHEDLVLAAIALGKPVFCEKPLAVSAAGCMRIVEAEMARGRRLVQVGFMRPYDPGYRALKQAVASGQIGAPLMAHCAHRNASAGQGYTTGMAITDTLIHELDVLRWLLDDDYASAQVLYPKQTRHAAPPLRDPQIVLLETVGGVRIDVEVFVNCRYGYDIQCEIVGETGIVRLPEPAGVALKRAARHTVPVLTDWKQRFATAYDAELQAFVDGVRGGRLTGPSAWDGYAAAVAADACLRAQSSGAVQRLATAPRPVFYQD